VGTHTPVPNSYLIVNKRLAGNVCESNSELIEIKQVTWLSVERKTVGLYPPVELGNTLRTKGLQEKSVKEWGTKRKQKS
jgi:hypothetical protein